MFRGPLLFFAIIIYLNVFGQAEIYISTEEKKIEIVDIDPNNNCSSQNTVVGTISSLSDITLHPNGKMYGCNFNSRKIYEVNLTTGALTELATISDAEKLVGMTADANGVIYITEGNVVPSRLYTFDINTNTFTEKGFLTDGSAGDLTWYFGNLYNASDDNKLVKVNIEDPASSEVIGPFNGVVEAGDRIFALVTVIASCDESITYGLSEFGDYYTIDMNTASVQRLCDRSTQIYGSTSADEFNASECFIEIDLDEDNSSGATGSDFETDFNCQPSKSANIADVDTDILVAGQVDSIWVSFANGIFDDTDEFLEVNSMSNITVNSAVHRIKAYNNGSADVADFEAFLNTLEYRNIAFPATPGVRTIEVIAFSEGRSDTAFAEITLEGVHAGDDGSLSICPSEPATNLFNQLSDNPDAGGTWIPALASGTNMFNPSVDAAGIYNYVVSNTCFTDTSQVEVTIGNSGSFSLGNDTSLCFATNLVLNADIGNPTATYLWSNGATTPTTTVNATGNYSVTIDIGGCQLQDDIDVEFVGLDVDLGPDFSLCPGETAMIGQNVGIAGATYSWNTGQTTDSIVVSAAGLYELTVSVNACNRQSDVNVTIANGGNILVDIGNDTTLCEGSPLVLNTGLNTSTFNHVWNDNSTNNNLAVTTAGTYSVTVTNSCQTGSASVDVNFVPNSSLAIDLGDDLTLCQDSIFQIQLSVPSQFSSNAFNILWSDGSTTPSITATSFDTYSVDVSNDCATGSDAITIAPEFCDTFVFDACEILFPTAFSPNGDNHNDMFGPVNECEDFISYELFVYNRYGEEVFRGKDTPWDGTYKGKRVPLDNFIWFATFEYADKEELETARGNIVVIQ